MISLVALLSGAAAPFLWVKGDAVIPGVRINGFSAGGRSRAELMDVLDEQNRAMEKEKLALVKDSAREEWSYKDLHVRYDEHSLDEAMEIGRQGSLFKQWEVRWKVLLSGRSAHIDAAFDENVLKDKIGELVKKYGQPAQNALPRFHNDGSVTFSRGRPHLAVKEEDLTNKVREMLETGKGGEIEIPVTEEVKPNMSDKEASEVNRVLGRYSTSFGGDANRSSNISLAAEKISGTYLKPGDGFSYNQTTGSRSAANGYKEAPVIINGKLEPGSGGGVCQVSSTLFNAVILS